MDLHIPKVSISGDYDLRAILRDMGIADQVNGTDFSGITREAQLKASKVNVPRAGLPRAPQIHCTNIISNTEPIHERVSEPQVESPGSCPRPYFYLQQGKRRLRREMRCL